MLKVSNNFREKVLGSNELEGPKSLQWSHSLYIEDVGTYDGYTIKSASVTGQLQSQFTLGSSLSRSLEVELLISEKTELPEGGLITLTNTLVVYNKGTKLRSGTLIGAGLILEGNLVNEDYILEYDLELLQDAKEEIFIGSFYITDIDRKTIGRLKINAIDAMGHTDILSSLVSDNTFANLENNYVDSIASAIAAKFGLAFENTNNELTIDNFNNSVLKDYTYRELLEYLAGFCGLNVKLTNDNVIKFFRFTKIDDITLSKNNYYNMTKGQNLFKAESIACTINDTTTVLGNGKDSSTIKFTNPYMTNHQLENIYHEYCYDGTNTEYIKYFPITMSAIGTCLFEPGDIIEVHDHYNESYDLYIQDYKLTCQNGVKESYESYFEYNKGSIANSISGRINKLTTDIAAKMEEFSGHYVSNTDFELVVNDLTTNLEYANNGLNKWIVEYYELGESNTNYGIESIITKSPVRVELVEDADSMSAINIEGNMLVRFYTSIYIEPLDDNLVQNITFRTSEGVSVHFNGNALNPETRDISLQEGWNIIEIFTGTNMSTSLTTYFQFKWEQAPIYDESPFYHITDMMTESEKDQGAIRYITVNWMDVHGNVLNSEIRETKLGESYEINKYEGGVEGYFFSGYVDGDPLEGIVEDNVTVNKYYIQDDRALIIFNYIDEYGSQIRDRYIYEAELEKNWIVTSLDNEIEIDGYTYDHTEYYSFNSGEEKPELYSRIDDLTYATVRFTQEGEIALLDVYYQSNNPEVEPPIIDGPIEGPDMPDVPIEGPDMPDVPAPASEEIVEEEKYKRFEYVILMNPYAVTIDYSRITEVERLTTVDSIIDRISSTEVIDESGNSQLGIDKALGYSKKYSEVVQTVDGITQTVSEVNDRVTEQDMAMSEIKQEVDNVGFTFTTYSSGNYISNSSFSTDYPLSGFSYTNQYDYLASRYGFPYENKMMGSSRPKYTHGYIYHDDGVYKLRDDPFSITYDEGNVGRVYSAIADSSYRLLDSNDEKSYSLSSSNTLGFGYGFSLKQTLKSENDKFPFIYVDDTNSYQFFMSIKARAATTNLGIYTDYYREGEIRTELIEKTVIPGGSATGTLCDGIEYYCDYTGIAKIRVNFDNEYSVYQLNDLSEFTVNGIVAEITDGPDEDGWATIYMDPYAEMFEFNGYISLDGHDDTKYASKALHPYMFMGVTFTCIDGTTYKYDNLNRNITCNILKSDDYEYHNLYDINYNYKLLEKHYSLDNTWRTFEFFIDTPDEIIKNCKSITLEYSVVYYSSRLNTTLEQNFMHLDSYISHNQSVQSQEEYKEPILKDGMAFYICEPMFANTRDNIPVPYTDKHSELVTGATNITQDGITISRSDSLVTTEIKNNGMAVLYDGDTVAQFKENTLIPTLEVTKKLTAPTIFYNDKFGRDIPDVIDVCLDNFDDPDVGTSFDTNVKDRYTYFKEVNDVLQNYSFIKKDKITIHIRKDSTGKGVSPFAMGQGLGIQAFLLSDIKCGVIEILLDEDVVLLQPLVLKNIEGTVKVRGPIDKSEINLDNDYFLGKENSDEDATVYFTECAPVVPCIIAHNIRWLEVYGINFSGGRDFTSIYAKKDGFMQEGETYESEAQYFTMVFNKDYFPFTNNQTSDPTTSTLSGLYANSSIEELNNIVNTCAVFIGYCNLVEISRCNFPSVNKKDPDYSGRITSYYDVGVYGDHSDCYLFNNQGKLGQYYLNRDKCWFRLPVQENVTDEEWVQVIEPDQTNPTNKLPGFLGNIIESQVTNNTSGNDSNGDTGVDTFEPIIPDKDNNIIIDLPTGNGADTYYPKDKGIYPGGMFKKDSSAYDGLGELFVGTSDDKVYLGSLLWDGSPNGTYDASLFKGGSNISGYTRLKQNVDLLAVTERDPSTITFGEEIAGSHGKYFNSNYRGYGNYQESMLANNLGFSIAMPDLSTYFSRNTNKELIGAKIELEFDNAEYGNQYANRPLRGGGEESPGLNPWGSIAFGARLVYDYSHHDPVTDYTTTKPGLANMGDTSYFIEFLKGGNAINVGYSISGGGDSTVNFNEPAGGRPFVVGNDPREGFSMKETIDIASVKYDDTYSGINAIRSGLLKYVDIAPVLVNAGDYEVPSTDVATYNYETTRPSANITNNDLLTRTVSCFKLKSARLVLTIK